MSDTVTAPWTPEQVAKIREWQRSPWVHPLTCSGGNNGVDCPGDGDALLVMVAGLLCPECGRTQTWVPAICVNHGPLLNPFKDLGPMLNQDTTP